MKQILIVVVMVLLFVSAVSAKTCKDCTYEKPCTITEVNGCSKVSYDVYCMRDSKGVAHWLYGNSRSLWLDKCTSEMENPFK